jgi:hypothetical protein
MNGNEFVAGAFAGFASAVVIFMSVVLINLKVFKNETDLLRFCMTHSIPLEQCKIPEKGK